MSTPRGCTNLKLRRLSRTVARLYDAEMRPLGLNGAQYALLSHVVRLGPAPMRLRLRAKVLAGGGGDPVL